MGRSASQPVQTPGAPAPDTAGSADDSTTATQEQAALTTSTEAAADPDARIAELEAQLAAQAEENERLRSAAAADPKLPQVVYEPKTPHGKEKLAASATGSMTVAQVQQAIDEKRLPEPVTSYLCVDGYYARRA